MLLARTLFALFILPLALVSRAADAPAEVEAAKSRSAFFDGRFADLDALERRAGDMSIVLADGQTLHAAFYKGFDCLCHIKDRRMQMATLPIFKSQAEKWRKAYPQSTAANLAEAFYYIQNAYVFWGQAWSGPGPNDRPWHLEQLNEARVILDGMEDKHRNDPEWWSARIQVAALEAIDRSEFEKLLNEGLRRHPGYFPIYFKASEYYRSNAQLDAFITKSVEMTRAAWGDMLYARMHWNLRRDDMFVSGRTDWQRMKRSFETLVAKYPDPWNLNNFAKFACIAGDAPTTADVMKRIEGKVAIEAWGGDMALYAGCKTSLAGAPGTHASR
jgi:hypothetical protein